MAKKETKKQTKQNASTKEAKQTKSKNVTTNSNWINLAVGIFILLVVFVFSFWYFSKTPQNSTNMNKNTVNDLVVAEDADSKMQENDTENENNPEMMEKQDTETSMEQEIVNDIEGSVVVQAGETLWSIAQRECNNGEAYTFIARANGYNNPNFANVAVGQVIKIDCGN